ncbi:MAG: flagellar hook protein FlgE [Candidatus Eisenbacteria bacterium]|nr:flagellar hook protein FlgE [Candidatus Eisenbacteria bacterium]
MLRAMFSGVTGLRAHQTMMDVIGNNIANINTIGFKTGRARFAEQFSQLLQAASPGSGTQGGTNPMQIGMGTGVAGIDNFFGQGTLENTGLGTDLAIQGDGFFILGSGGGQQYTRAGAFSFDAQGRLVDPGTGKVVQGYMADAAGTIAPGTALSDLRISTDATASAKPTTQMEVHGNLDAGAAAGTNVDVTTTVYDSRGNKHSLTLRLTKDATSPLVWNVTIPTPPTGYTATGGAGALTFNTDGTLNTSSVTDLTLAPSPANGAADIVVKLATTTSPAYNPFGTMTSSAGDTTAFVFSQDGYSAGNLVRTSIDSQGHVVGSFSNGVTRTLAQVALARFINDAGLTKGNGNSWEESLNSGRAVVGSAGSGSFGSISAGALEGSNVDLASEFTDLITAQRGFQANARMITTGDELLSEVVNIKR